MKTYLSLFESKRHGLWVNEAEQMCVALNEDYKRTFRAYLDRRPNENAVIVNANGNPLRFRTAEAAAKHLLTDTN